SKLSPHPDEGSGLFMLNTTAAALVSENKAFSFPASVDSMAIDTTEDHVSMGSVAARKAMAIIANPANVLALELACACQGINLHSPLRASPPTQALLKAVRGFVPFVEHDRPLSVEIATLADAILSGEIAGSVEQSLGRTLA
ncbi:MAG TPA: aromatic amino acid lyase, partial [Patescibacteria group bacterium]|nr:aromatic amino acid lyase [Patescibacteria group bacterium]